MGEAGGVWCLTRRDEKWELSSGVSGDLKAEVKIPQAVAWKLFTKGLPPEAAHQFLQVSGEKTLTEPIFHAKAIIG